jgi:hypothetical protein
MISICRSLAGRALLRSYRIATSSTQRLRLMMPRVFGMPVHGAMVQLYRQDGQYSTLLSLMNYMSLFLPGHRIAIVYRIRAWNRSGKLIGTGIRTLGYGETAQIPLADIIGFPLDEFGIFAVDARYEPKFIPEAEFLRTTTAQFMTLFVPSSSASSTQMIHSHKDLDRFPLPFSPNQRRSPIVIDLTSVAAMDHFILNSCRTRLRGNLRFHDASSDALCHEESFDIPGYGVERLRFLPSRSASLPTLISTELSCDRLTSHRKPILFREFISGAAACNHS